MIISTDQYMVRSQNANLIYWEQDIYPAWTTLGSYRHFRNGEQGSGVEPHYHDGDEIWLFTSGRGEVWLDDTKYDITPNTMVYTPMGCIHRFQMFTSYENSAIVTQLEREQRPIHITIEEHGPPVPTVHGFTIPGEDNTGPIPDPGSRCPLSEWRMMTLGRGEEIDKTTLDNNEHWVVMTGAIILQIDRWEVELSSDDVALIRGGTRRRICTQEGAELIVAREH